MRGRRLARRRPGLCPWPSPLVCPSPTGTRSSSSPSRVILATLVLQGLTLTPLIRRAAPGRGRHSRLEEAWAREAAARAALTRLEALTRDPRVTSRGSSTACMRSIASGSSAPRRSAVDAADSAGAPPIAGSATRLSCAERRAAHRAPRSRASSATKSSTGSSRSWTWRPCGWGWRSPRPLDAALHRGYSGRSSGLPDWTIANSRPFTLRLSPFRAIRPDACLDRTAAWMVSGRVDVRPSPRQQELIALARGWPGSGSRPAPSVTIARRPFLRRLCRSACGGLLGLCVPERFGGLGGRFRDLLPGGGAVRAGQCLDGAHLQHALPDDDDDGWACR